MQREIASASQKNEHPLTNQAHLTLDFDSSSAKKIAMDPLKGAALVICTISLHKTASTKRTFITQFLTPAYLAFNLQNVEISI